MFCTSYQTPLTVNYHKQKNITNIFLKMKAIYEKNECCKVIAPRNEVSY